MSSKHRAGPQRAKHGGVDEIDQDRRRERGMVGSALLGLIAVAGVIVLRELVLL